MLDAQKSLWPTIVATTTKRTLLSCGIVAVVAYVLCAVVLLYQNAAVLHLNVNVAIFCTESFIPIEKMVILVQKAKYFFHKRDAFLHPS